MKAFLKEFKEFINRGSIMDMAVGVIIGGAFTAIVNSLTEDIIMPIVLWICGGIKLDTLSITFAQGATLNYGKFLQAVIVFLITAFVVFCMLKAMNKIMRKKKEPEKAPAPDPQVVLLTEIRDMLQKDLDKAPEKE